MKQSIVKTVIKEHATKNKMFLRILKELRLYKIYFRLLDKCGNTEKCIPVDKDIKMESLVMRGFYWGHDETFLRNSWAQLYALLIRYNINEISKINKLKKNDLWNQIKSRSINKPQ